jgi:hypothetical protein
VCLGKARYAVVAGSAVTILIDANTVTVIHQDTGEVLSEHTIDPKRSYQVAAWVSLSVIEAQ